MEIDYSIFQGNTWAKLQRQNVEILSKYKYKNGNFDEFVFDLKKDVSDHKKQLNDYAKKLNSFVRNLPK